MGAAEAFEFVELEDSAWRHELAQACGNLWAMALAVYYNDCRAALVSATYYSDGGEALDDLTSDRRLLANICEVIDADPQRVGDAMITALDAGLRFRASGMNRAVEEIRENFTGCKPPIKKRGKPQPISLR